MMKKYSHLLSASALLLLLPSCSQDDIATVHDGAGEKIIFRTKMPAVSARASETKMDNLEEIYITAFNPGDPDKVVDGTLNPFLDNITATRAEGDPTAFTSDECVWPAQSNDDGLKFFAWHPALNDGAALVNASRLEGAAPVYYYKITGFRVDKDIARQTDFITASATGKMKNDLFSGIKLDFEHKLSQVEIKAYGVNPNVSLEIAGVRLGGVGVGDTYDFVTGGWTGSPVKDAVEYIYGAGDKIVSLDNKGDNTITSADDAASLMGQGGNAMLIPSTLAEWNYDTDRYNVQSNMYLSILLRVKDNAGKQQYPYTDNSAGANVPNIPVVCLVVDADNNVTGRVYKKDGAYFTDETGSVAYTGGGTVKEFGWAALATSAEWQPGKIYTYTLNYSNGVGLHDPEVEPVDPDGPGPKGGDPIISSDVPISVTVKGWLDGGTSNVEVPAF